MCFEQAGKEPSPDDQDNAHQGTADGYPVGSDAIWLNLKSVTPGPGTPKKYRPDYRSRGIGPVHLLPTTQHKAQLVNLPHENINSLTMRHANLTTIDTCLNRLMKDSS